MSDKQIILNTVAQIDDATSYEEILYALYLQYEVSKGIRDMEENNVKTSDEVKEIIKKMVIWAETAINHITQFIDDAKSGTEQTAKKYIEKLIDYVEILNEMPNIGKTFASKVYKYELRQLLYK